MRGKKVLFLLIAVPVCLLMPSSLQGAEPAEDLRVATFQCEVTPPLGDWLYVSEVKTVEHPLLAKGILLEQGDRRFVLAAIDWCVLSGQARTLLREKMAAGAATEPSRATIQCVHVHTGPIIDMDAKRLLEDVEKPPEYYDPAFLQKVAEGLEAAVAEARDRLVTCDRIGTSQVKVDRVASSRRIMVDGKVVWRASSRGNNQRLADLPEGFIDPHLKTITFAQGETPIARLHYYATHPQSYYRDARASYDFVGMAREKLQEEEDVFQVYFTGCAGDVAAGKYNNGTSEAREKLYKRLLSAMRKAASSVNYQPVSPIVFRTADLMLPHKETSTYNPERFRAMLRDTRKDPHRRIWAARRLAFFDRQAPIVVSSLQMGDIYILHLPGEPMVEFQLFAQRRRPDAFVAVAGYGEGGTCYICTDEAFEEGAYEPGAAAVGPGSEAIVKEAIRKLLGLDD